MAPCRTQILLFVAVSCLTRLIQIASFELPAEVTEILAKDDAKRTAPLGYSIFRGRSSLRDLTSKEQNWMEFYGKSASSLLLFLSDNRDDAAHEVILGVTPSNVAEAEYAATHPGSGWTEQHPLSTVDDWIHSIIHRDGEGDFKGEGNHTGWENAMYWAAGGPKTICDEGRVPLCTHPVARRLAQEAPRCAPQSCQRGLIVSSDSGASSPSTHSVLADGGKRRTVCIPPGHWDPFCFIRLLRAAPVELQPELEHLRALERRYLLEHCLREQRLAADDDDSA